MKTTRLITTILALSLLLSILAGISVAALELNDDLIINDSSSEEELMPMSTNTSDQYANQHFKTLAAAKRYYGTYFEYTSCNVNIAPGCYGGYWSNGGHYSYYYTMSDGSKVYIHVG